MSIGVTHADRSFPSEKNCSDVKPKPSAPIIVHDAHFRPAFIRPLKVEGGANAPFKETLIKLWRTVNRMGSLQCLKLHQAARSAWGLGLTAREQGRTAAGRLPEGEA